MSSARAILYALVVVVVIAAVTLGGTLLVFHLSTRDDPPPYAKRYRDHCAAVSASLDQDARDFASTDPKRQLEAEHRFGGVTIYHSDQEIILCSNVAPDLRRRDGCWIEHDYKCLAEIARAASISTKP